MKTAKYIACIDYKASYKPMTLDFIQLASTNIMDAMVEAESLMDTAKVYLITVMERKSVKSVAGWKGVRAATYGDILTNRGCGWHKTDEAHSEVAFEHECYFTSDGKFIA